MARAGQAADGRALYRCDVCGNVDHWGEGWIWFGSAKDLDDGRPVFMACSEKCQSQRMRVAKAMGLPLR